MAACNAFLMLTAAGLWSFVIQPTALAALVLTFAVAWPIGRRIADHYRCPRAIAVLFVLAVGLVVALTMTPNEPAPRVIEPAAPPHFLTQLHDGHFPWSALIAPPDDSEQVANIVLYIPVGFLGRLVWRSAVRAAGFGMALTVFIETCQYGIVGRVGSITDIRNNTAGAILGAALAAATIEVLRRRNTS
jgi:glycopeptide antibiotics resistance protein